MSKFSRFLGGPNGPKICVGRTKFDFEDWGLEVGQCWIFKEITKNKKADGELVQWAVVVALRCFSDGTFPSVALFNYGESRQRGFLIKNCVSETSHPHFIVFLALFFSRIEIREGLGREKKIMSNLLF